MEARVLVDRVFFFLDLGFLGEIGRPTRGEFLEKERKKGKS